MIDCQLKPTGLMEGGLHEFVCATCGQTKLSKYPDPELIHRVCASDPVSEPSIVEKGWNYAKALARWTAADKPRRSAEEISELLVIYRECQHYRPNKKDVAIGHCRVCGCGLNEQNDVTNKIMMATENCPKGKW